MVFDYVCVVWFGLLYVVYGMCLCRLVHWKLGMYRTHQPLSVMMRLQVQLQQRALPCFHFQQTKGLEVAPDLRVVAAMLTRFLVSRSTLVASDISME